MAEVNHRTNPLDQIGADPSQKKGIFTFWRATALAGGLVAATILTDGFGKWDGQESAKTAETTTTVPKPVFEVPPTTTTTVPETTTTTAILRSSTTATAATRTVVSTKVVTDTSAVKRLQAVEPRLAEFERKAAAEEAARRQAEADRQAAAKREAERIEKLKVVCEPLTKVAVRIAYNMHDNSVNRFVLDRTYPKVVPSPDAEEYGNANDQIDNIARQMQNPTDGYAYSMDHINCTDANGKQYLVISRAPQGTTS